MVISIIPELASSMGRKDEEPNKDLGKRLVESNNLAGIQEVGENLGSGNRVIQIDCLAVLEQVGLLAPDLIEDYLDEFLRLAFGKENRLIWASMINIALIAARKPDQIMDHVEGIMEVIKKGSVITQDNGIKILARAAAAKPAYNERLFPYLINQLVTCRPKSIPQYVESIRVAVNPGNKSLYLGVLNSRLEELSSAQQKRVSKIINAFEQ